MPNPKQRENDAAKILEDALANMLTNRDNLDLRGDFLQHAQDLLPGVIAELRQLRAFLYENLPVDIVPRKKGK